VFHLFRELGGEDYTLPSIQNKPESQQLYSVGAALRGRPCVEFNRGAATEGRPYSYAQFKT